LIITKIQKKKTDFRAIEFPIIKKNGADLWVSQSNHSLQHRWNIIIAYSGIVRDITTLKEIEKQSKN
jgi:PAS domain S-box-containing protein